MQTLRRQRIQKFTKIITVWITDSPAIEGVIGDALILEEEIEKIAVLLADAAESRTERKTDELQGGYDLLDGMLKYAAPEQAKEKLATDAFERAFGIIRPWDWYPAKTTIEKTWRDFRKYLVELYEADKDCFTKYATWSKQPYVRGAMTALGIKRNPQDFPDSWAAYCASEMYNKPSAPQYKKYEEKEDEYVPNKLPKPRIF